MGDTIVYWRSEGRHDTFVSGQQEAPGETDCKLRTGLAGPAVAGLLACHGKQTADQRQMQAVFKAGKIRRKDVFVTKTLWNRNHRPERVKPTLDASLRRLKLDCRDERCQVIYDRGVAVIETWQELERLVDDGRCKSIGLSDVALEKLREIVAAYLALFSEAGELNSTALGWATTIMISTAFVVHSMLSPCNGCPT